MPLIPVPEPDDEFVPQAILSLSEQTARRRYGLRDRSDDFDRYVGATFLSDDNAPFSLRRYAGHPPDTFTIYMPVGSRDVREITRRVFSIVAQLDLPRTAVTWERSQDPDL